MYDPLKSHSPYSCIRNFPPILTLKKKLYNFSLSKMMWYYFPIDRMVKNAA